MSDASLAASLSSLMTFLREARDSYCSVKSLSMSTPSLLFGRSRICPIEATTLKPAPRYLLMVFALAGDSTTTSAFAIPAFSPYHGLSNPNEPSTPCTSDQAAQLQLEQAGQQF